MAKREQLSTTQRLRTSYLSSVISTALVLFLLGVVGLLVFNAGRMSNYVKENMIIDIFIKNEVSDKDAMQFLARLEKKEYTRSAKYISREEATQNLRNDLGESFLDDKYMKYTLPIKIELKLNSSYIIPDSMELLKSQLSRFPEVSSASYNKVLLETINNNIEKISTIILIFVVLLLFVSWFLINNTIRLSIYSKRFLINTMKLVGANTSFIRTPFLASSVWQGLLSGFIAIILLLGLITILRRDFSEILMLTDATMVAGLFAMMLILGSVISFLSTYFIVTKYTQINSEDLYF